MDNEKVYTASLRLYKKRPVHAQAYRYLKDYNTDIFKTKDDFIAEAIIYFSRYLKQEEEVKQAEDMDAYLKRKNGHLLEQMLQMQREIIPDMVKTVVSEALRGFLVNSVPAAESLFPADAVQNDCTEKDMQFAQFYEMDED